MRYFKLLLIILLAFIFIVGSSFQVDEINKPGFRYRHITQKGPQSIYIMEVDPKLCTIKAAKAHPESLGRETVATIAQNHHAFAAVNGSFFKIGSSYDGISTGILKIERKWFSLPSPTKPRGSIGWAEGGKKVWIDQLLATCFVLAGDKKISVNGINRPRQPNEVIVYLPTFNSTTFAAENWIDYIIKDSQLSSTNQKTPTTIPPNGWVLSIPKKDQNPFWKQCLPGSKMNLLFEIYPQSSTKAEDWNQADYIVGGTPVLIRQGNVITDYSSEKTILTFLTHRHARTAIGIKPEGSWVFVVIDGKQPFYSLGMTMIELAHFMKELGCVEALNLDGGGSSTMVIQGKVQNDPYGDEDESADEKTVRRVSDAILIFVP